MQKDNTTIQSRRTYLTSKILPGGKREKEREEYSTHSDVVSPPRTAGRVVSQFDIPTAQNIAGSIEGPDL